MIIGKLIYNKAEQGEVRFIKEFDEFPCILKLDILGDIKYDIEQKYDEAYNEMSITFAKIKEQIA